MFGAEEPFHISVDQRNVDGAEDCPVGAGLADHAPTEAERPETQAQFLGIARAHNGKIPASFRSLIRERLAGNTRASDKVSSALSPLRSALTICCVAAQ